MKLGIGGSGALWLWFVLLEHTIALYAERLIRKLAMFVWCRKQCGQHPTGRNRKKLLCNQETICECPKTKKGKLGEIGVYISIICIW